MPPYRFIMLDLDGTLTDPKAGITRSIRHALRRMGLAELSDKQLEAFIGPPLHESFAHYCSLSLEDATRAVACYREYYADTGIFENALYPGIAELLPRLRATGSTLFLVTSKPTVYAERILRHFGISEHFSCCVGANLDGTMTAKRELVRSALEEAARRGILDADRAAWRASAVMVGDREHDVLGAGANGVDTVAVAYGYGSVDELRSAGALHIAATVGDLAAVLTLG